MVVINDFRKQILYQRLNLGYDCNYCKTKFYSKLEQLQHLREAHFNPGKKEQLECSICGKVFGHAQIYQLHLQIHALSNQGLVKSITIKDGNNISGISATVTRKPIHTPKCKKEKQKTSNKNSSTSSKKATGLTKVKLEDCMRCDACSCIYIDRSDYLKHMRNFHKINIEADFESTTAATKLIELSSPVSTSVKPTVTHKSPNKQVVSPKKKCKACCKQCRGIQSKCESQHQLHHGTRTNQRTSSNHLFKFSMQDNIKDRWSKMVSQRLLETEEKEGAIQIKPDPDARELESSIQNIIDSDEMSHLLSQVEVKIKIEPPDD